MLGDILLDIYFYGYYLHYMCVCVCVCIHIHTYIYINLFFSWVVDWWPWGRLGKIPDSSWDIHVSWPSFFIHQNHWLHQEWDSVSTHSVWLKSSWNQTLARSLCDPGALSVGLGTHSWSWGFLNVRLNPPFPREPKILYCSPWTCFPRELTCHVKYTREAEITAYQSYH